MKWGQVIAMANLEVKTQMSALQLSIVVITTCIGGAQIMRNPRDLIEIAEQGAWLSIIVGGILFYIAACLMIKLGKQYPDETLVEYAPRLFGTWGGGVVILWFYLLFLLQLIQNITSAGKVITFHMFDRTPPEVVILALLVLCTYSALQDWGTILRVQQFIFFVAYGMLTVVWMVSSLNLQPENLLPLWPIKIKPILNGGIATWNMYAGYECILLLLPVVYKGVSFRKLAKTMGGTFVYLSLFFMVLIIIIIGVLTVESAKNVPYPALVVIRSVELPGTFIERLENYLLLAWVPVIFGSFSVVMFFMGQIGMRYYRYADHRPWVLALIPIIYVSSMLLLDDPQGYKEVTKLIVWTGLGFSFGVVPLALLLSWRQRRKARVRCG